MSHALIKTLNFNVLKKIPTQIKNKNKQTNKQTNKKPNTQTNKTIDSIYSRLLSTTLNMNHTGWRNGRDRMVGGFTNTSTISTY